MRRYPFVLVLMTILVMVLAMAGHAEAQSPWTVTVTPSLNPLPVGFCTAIQLRVLDATGRDVPRNAAGARVTIADFDITVAGTGVVVDRIDAFHWVSCACQGAAVGSTATVTASYPAQSLAENARVPDVTVQETATITLAAAKGTANPPACAAAAKTAAVSTAGTPVMPPPVTVPDPLPRGARVPAAPATPPQVGPAPTFVEVSGNPAETVVTWFPPFQVTPAPTGYVVERWKLSDPACCRTTSPTLTTREWRDPLTTPGDWRYQVTAIYADGRRGSSIKAYAYPEPVVPTGLEAEQTGRNGVVLTWQPVAGAAYYVVAGPPTNQAIRVDGTSLTRTGLPYGDTSWQVSAMYLGAAGSPQHGSAFAKTAVKVVNTHYRLVAESVRVTAETVDTPLSTDGKFDEIYVASVAETYDRGTRILISREPVRMSHVHGDVNSLSPAQRVKAGTGSATGGVRTNDIVSQIFAAPSPATPGGAPPFVLWDGDLVPGRSVLILHPTIWEVDQPDDALARQPNEAEYMFCGAALCNWVRYFKRLASQSWPVESAVVAAPAFAVLDGVDMGDVRFVHLERHDRDRPIGLVVRTTNPNPDGQGLTGGWRDKIVVVTSEKIDAALASGTNRIEVRFWDRWDLPNTAPSKVNYLNGDYTLVIRVERMP